MANYRQKLSGNIDGDYFVDNRCINCDNCRELAPEVFREQDSFSIVYQQPMGMEARERTIRAVISCPTRSIGSIKDNHSLLRKEVETQFPLKINDNVFYLGFNSPKSFGAKSYLITHPQGNWMVDSPRFNRYLKEQIKSIEKLINYNFEWILPGHGRSYHLAVATMKAELIEFVESVKNPDYW